MESLLNKLYHGCGVAGAACIFVMAFSVVAEVIVRMFGMSLPGVIEVATFALVSASFLALAHTFRHNVHIRISVVTHRLPKKMQRYFEMFALVVAGIVCFWLTVYAAKMCLEAYEFNDRSDGLLSIPLWIPQAVMTIGILLLAISIIEEFVKVVRGRTPTYELYRDVVQDNEDTGDKTELNPLSGSSQ